MNKINTLVTGGAGFIGSHVVDSLLALGHDVLVLDDLSGGFKENVNPAATFIHGSVADPKIIADIFSSHQIDYIYHLGAYAAEGLSHFIRCYNYLNNLVGSTYLLNAALNHGGIKCFVFTSSIAVYGAAQCPMTEETVPRPDDPYGIAKYAFELDLQAARKMFGQHYIVFRPHNVIGERQNIGDPYRNVVGIFMNQCMQGRPLTIFGDGFQKRAFTHVSDVAPIIANSVNIPAAYDQVFNIGADTPYSVNELASMVQKVMGTSLRMEHLPAREEVVMAFSNHDKCKRVFGETAKVGLEEGLQRMAAWAKQHGARTGKAFANIEIERNMPQSWRQLTWHNNPLP